VGEVARNLLNILAIRGCILRPIGGAAAQALPLEDRLIADYLKRGADLLSHRKRAPENLVPEDDAPERFVNALRANLSGQ
jgi:hypothetical protein